MRPTVKLWEICDILDKKRKPITQKDRTKWIYPYYWASWILDYVADYIFDEDLVLIWEDWAKRWALDNSAFKVSWKVWVNNHAHVIRPHREKILDDFLVYFLVSSDLSDYITWTTVPKLNQERLKLIQIPLPPLETQKAIVAKLDQIFAELDQTKSEIQKNLDNTDELWKSSLNQAFQGDWEMKKLGEVCDKITDWSHNPPKWIENSDYIMISSRNIDEWKIIFDDVRYLEKQDFDLEDKRTNVKEWDVLLSIVWTIWKVCVVKKEYWKFTMQRSVAVVKPLENKLYSYYLSYFLQAPLFQNVINENARWVAQKWIYLNSVKSLQIPVPPLSEQEKIVEHLDQVSKEVKALKSHYQSQLDNLEELKKSVLDKAFRWEMG